MKKAKVVLGLLILVCGLALAGGVLAANGSVIERSVFGSGGERVTGGGLYILDGTLGEPIASDVALGTNYGLSSGYWWPRGPSGPSGPSCVYLPLVVRNYRLIVVENGGFETGDFSGWTIGGDESGLRPRVVTSHRHSGGYAAVLGQENAPCEHGQGGLVGQSWIYQDVTVPDSGSPQLTFYYRILTYDKLSADEFDRFEVTIDGTLLGRFGNTSPNYQCSNPINDLGWQPFTYDLSAYRGQTIRLRLVNITYPDDWFGTWTYVDDVTVTQ
jgi:hypothetical protein